MSSHPAVPDQLVVRLRVTEILEEFYARCDRGDSVADLLDENAQFVTPHRNAQGRDAFAALLLSLAKNRREQGGAGRHFGTNINIEDLGSGQFRVRSLMLFIAMDGGPGTKGFMNLGDHDDIVAFDARGNCRFVKRAMTPVAQFALSPLGDK